jgi:hypothetical protein
VGKGALCPPRPPQERGKDSGEQAVLQSGETGQQDQEEEKIWSR